MNYTENQTDDDDYDCIMNEKKAACGNSKNTDSLIIQKTEKEAEKGTERFHDYLLTTEAVKLLNTKIMKKPIKTILTNLKASKNNDLLKKIENMNELKAKEYIIGDILKTARHHAIDTYSQFRPKIRPGQPKSRDFEKKHNFFMRKEYTLSAAIIKEVIAKNPLDFKGLSFTVGKKKEEEEEE